MSRVWVATRPSTGKPAVAVISDDVPANMEGHVWTEYMAAAEIQKARGWVGAAARELADTARSLSRLDLGSGEKLFRCSTGGRFDHEEGNWLLITDGMIDVARSLPAAVKIAAQDQGVDLERLERDEYGEIMLRRADNALAYGARIMGEP